jgi:hypothetical protein
MTPDEIGRLLFEPVVRECTMFDTMAIGANGRYKVIGSAEWTDEDWNALYARLGSQWDAVLTKMNMKENTHAQD